VKVTKTLSLNNFIVRLASLGAVWQQGVIPQEQTTRWTGGYDFGDLLDSPLIYCSVILSDHSKTFARLLARLEQDGNQLFGCR